MRGRTLSVACGLGLLLCLGFSCSSDPGTRPEEDAGLMALKVGNTWRYKSFRVDPQSGDTTNVEEFTVTIIGTRTLENSRYFELNTGDVVQNRTDGLFMAEYNPATGQFLDDLLFAFPVSNGHTYSYTSVAQGETFTIRVTEERISVPAGIFDCLAYQFVDKGWIIYFAPNVGLVRTENFDGQGEGMVLLSYTLL